MWFTGLIGFMYSWVELLPQRFEARGLAARDSLDSQDSYDSLDSQDSYDSLDSQDSYDSQDSRGTWRSVLKPEVCL